MKLSETITKRKDGRYMGRFIIGRDSNGKSQYQYVYGETYDEAEKKLMIGKAIESEYLSGRSVSVKQAYTEWLHATANRVKESSLANYKQKFEKHILPVFGEMLCSELTADAINTFICNKLTSGLSAGFVRDIFTVFKTMLKFAQEEHDFKLSLKNIALPKVYKKTGCAIDRNDQKALVGYLKENINTTSFGIMISLFMGVRIGELCGLQWSDVDFENKTLRINRTVQRISAAEGNRKTKVIISTPKSQSSRRVISIPDCLMPYFEMFRANGYILSGTEKVVEPRTMQYRYKKVLAAAKVSAHNYHKLRHTFATNCIGSGFDAKTLSNVLGHSNITLTLTRYVHPDITRERRLMNNMCLRI